MGGQTLTSRSLFRGSQNILVLEIAGVSRIGLGGGCVAGVGGQTLTSRRLFRGSNNILALEIAGVSRIGLGGQAA